MVAIIEVILRYRGISPKEALVGRFRYGDGLVVDFDDRLLAHLQLVIGAKIRRGESFYFSWKDDPGVGDGRTSVWVHPAVPMSFKYYGSRMPQINRAWIDALTQTANAPIGLQVVPEPDGPAELAD